MKQRKVTYYIITILIMLVSFVLILIVCDKAIIDVKKTKNDAVLEVKKRDFEAIWAYIITTSNVAEKQAAEVANKIEKDINSEFADLDNLKSGLDNDDPEIRERLGEIIRDDIDDVYLGNIKNNRNSMIVLEGYTKIVEDLFVDPESREDTNIDESKLNTNLITKYRSTTYNKELFDNALRRIRNHTDQLIAIEPYNYIESTKKHTKIPEMSFANLESVYIEEGIEGLRNYQFLVPIYITDTGDIFGQRDIVNGVRQENHKFIVIQTFNIYDQLIDLNPQIGDDDYLRRMNTKYDAILTSLYIFGLISCIVIVFVILYFFSIYNMLIEKNNEIKKLNNTTEKENLKNKNVT